MGLLLAACGGSGPSSQTPDETEPVELGPINGNGLAFGEMPYNVVASDDGWVVGWVDDGAKLHLTEIDREGNEKELFEPFGDAFIGSAVIDDAGPALVYGFIANDTFSIVALRPGQDPVVAFEGKGIGNAGAAGVGDGILIAACVVDPTNDASLFVRRFEADGTLGPAAMRPASYCGDIGRGLVVASGDTAWFLFSGTTDDVDGPQTLQLAADGTFVDAPAAPLDPTTFLGAAATPSGLTFSGVDQDLRGHAKLVEPDGTETTLFSTAEGSFVTHTEVVADGDTAIVVMTELNQPEFEMRSFQGAKAGATSSLKLEGVYPRFASGHGVLGMAYVAGDTTLYFTEVAPP